MSNVIKKVIKNWVEYDIYANGGAAGAGDVSWPASATNWHLAVFDWTTGKLIKDWWAVPTSKSAVSWGTDTSLVTTWEKYTWNNKQSALSTQTAYTTKWTATKVPTITTNTLWQVTAISETDITFPVTSVGGSTWAVWLKTINNNAITGTGNISVGTLTAETVASGDSGTTYTIKKSTTAPASATNTTITFVV